MPEQEETEETEKREQSGHLDARKPAEWETDRQRQAKMIAKLMERLEKQLDEKEAKVTIADFIRLWQLQKELEEHQPKEIKITWIETLETESNF